jgi:hypothetical protein
MHPSGVCSVRICVIVIVDRKDERHAKKGRNQKHAKREDDILESKGLCAENEPYKRDCHPSDDIVESHVFGEYDTRFVVSFFVGHGNPDIILLLWFFFSVCSPFPCHSYP